jgi:hypothetical protein
VKRNLLSSAIPTLAVLAARPAPASAGGGDPDLGVLGHLVVQTIQTGGTGLVGGKSTFARVAVSVSGTLPPGAVVDGLMRVYVGGVEAPFSPVFSDNGPIAPPVAATPDDENASLNFIFLPPVASDVVLEFEINPAGPGQIAESDTSNNKLATGALNFACRRSPEIVYVPIDYRPGGGTIPNLPDPNLTRPGIGDNFTAAIYPTGDWKYHRSVAESKLWTESLSGTGSGLLASLAADLNLMVPKPDFIYGWVPGGLPYNGQAIGIPGIAGMGNTEIIRFQRTMAHELGHLFGLQHNLTTISTVGIDVENQLNLTQSLGTIKAASLKDIMYAGLLTFEAWVAQSSYNHFYNHAEFTCTGAAPEPGAGPGLLAAGTWNHHSGALDLAQLVALPQATASASLAAESADLALRAWSAGELVGECLVSARSTLDLCAGCRGGAAADSELPPSPVGPFAAVIGTTVDPAAVERLTVVELSTGRVVADVRRSAHAPVVEFAMPPGGATLAGKLALAWNASDADGDELSYTVRYSPDGQRLAPLASDLAASALEIDAGALPRPVPGAAYFEVLASDGLATARATWSEFAPAPAAGGNAPWVYIATPDPSLSYLKGATVILHGNGWDLEDLELAGASLSWTSSLDGFLGSGRLTSVADLSVGTHQITLTGIDSSGLTASETNAITIIDRELPDAGTETCQTDLGFGGPGTASLELCGGDLSSGTTADLVLSGAPAGQPAWIAVGSTANPTLLFGGTLVPIPAASVVFGATDGLGVWTLPGIPGGNGPLTLYLQALVLDLALPELLAISNALQVDFLP